jgi:hypothetical protein
MNSVTQETSATPTPIGNSAGLVSTSAIGTGIKVIKATGLLVIKTDTNRVFYMQAGDAVWNLHGFKNLYIGSTVASDTVILDIAEPGEAFGGSSPNGGGSIPFMPVPQSLFPGVSDFVLTAAASPKSILPLGDYKWAAVSLNGAAGNIQVKVLDQNPLAMPNWWAYDASGNQVSQADGNGLNTIPVNPVGGTNQLFFIPIMGGSSILFIRDGTDYQITGQFTNSGPGG